MEHAINDMTQAMTKKTPVEVVYERLSVDWTRALKTATWHYGANELVKDMDELLRKV